MMKPTMMIASGGSIVWRLNGILHREDGPAVEHPDGRKEWWINGKRHREDGPAFELADNYKEWWVNGKEFQVENLAGLKRKIRELVAQEIHES